METAQRIETTSANPWEGPLVSETAYWATKSFTTNAMPSQVSGMWNSSATQVPGTVTCQFVTASGGSAFKTTGAVRLLIIADSVTSTTCKYDLAIFKAGTTAAVYSVTDQTVASTSVPTYVSIDAASLGTFAADTLYTIKLICYVKSSNGVYFGTPRIEVLK